MRTGHRFEGPRFLGSGSPEKGGSQDQENPQPEWTGLRGEDQSDMARIEGERSGLTPELAPDLCGLGDFTDHGGTVNWLP